MSFFSPSYWLGLREWPLLVALAVGLLIGLERERRKIETSSRSGAGLRTYALVGVMGGATAAMGNVGLVLVAGGFVAVSALTAYVLGDRKDPGLTGEVALMLTFALGALAQENPALAFEVGIVVAALLAFRVQLHRFVRERITDQELRDALTFAIAAVIILPLLPNRAIDPFGLLNPFTLWRLGVVAMGLSFVGYIAQRTLGGRYGLLLAGLAAGLISSTAAVAAMGSQAKADPQLANASAAGAVASMIGSLIYLVLLIEAVSPRLVFTLALPLGLAVCLMLGYAAWLARQNSKLDPKAKPLGRAFSPGAVVLFVGLIGGFSLVSELLMHWLGMPGAIAGAAIMGLADAHAAAVSMATLLDGKRLTASVAAGSVILALSTNMLIKIPTAFVCGDRRYGRSVAGGAVLLVLGLWAGALLMARYGNVTFA